MKSHSLQLTAHVLVFSAMSASAAIRFVNVNSTSPAPPYNNWATAATTIQDAVDAAVAGDQILVTNGVYETAGRAVFGAMTNRVAVDKPVTIASVNGAAVTVIRGFQVPDTTNGDSAIRCVYLTNGAALVGFTLTNGATQDSSDDPREKSGGGVWCESTSAVVSNCTLTANSAIEGGGAWGGTLNNCRLSGNSANLQGGGAWGGTLNNCRLSDNSALFGDGGGASGCTLNNCALTGNSAGGGFPGGDGGGASGCTLNNCTLSGNLAAKAGGGVSGCTLKACIVYYNSARSGDNNYSDSSLSYSCTTPLPPVGLGNISAEPQLADLFHLSAGSPCRGAGSALYATGLDIDGETWANPPSIGCDEYHAGAVTGPLSLSIQAAYTNVAVGFTVNFRAAIDGRATANRWEFGDGTVLSNRLDAPHSWTAAGDYLVIFRAYNDIYPDGVSAMLRVHVLAQPVHYVAPGGDNSLAPYTSWATAANNIQDAVDAASVAGALVLVTNGVYQTGGRGASEGGARNRVAVTKALMVRSVNGAALTMIQGYRDPDDSRHSPVRCVYLANGAALVGFTLTNGSATYGGGVWCETASALVSNCVLTGNVAALGGGANGGTLSNCILNGNSTSGDGGGGGACACRLNNCILNGNSALNWPFGGAGAVYCALNNCIVYYNTLYTGGEDNYSHSVLSYSCTTPLPSGIGNFTNAPLFVDYAGGNLRLQSNSPCINAGSNASAPAGPDLDGNPRIAGGPVDIGAYEFQSPQSLISYAWLQQYNLPTDSSADVTDVDGDGLNNWQEWRAGTNPTNALSVLHLLSPAPGAPGLVVSWQSVSGLNYFLERGTDLGAQPSFLPLASNIVGQPGTTTFTDSNAVGAGPFFYRVRAQE